MHRSLLCYNIQPDTEPHVILGSLTHQKLGNEEGQNQRGKAPARTLSAPSQIIGTTAGTEGTTVSIRRIVPTVCSVSTGAGCLATGRTGCAQTGRGRTTARADCRAIGRPKGRMAARPLRCGGGKAAASEGVGPPRVTYAESVKDPKVIPPAGRLDSRDSGSVTRESELKQKVTEGPEDAIALSANINCKD
ncbi:hypothetical protein M5K25_006815 [Dendrobium thyrsiflorum]|uniref:Uncharacterized protein n=1 Tax=Dendrobium thyrsiflorum TaxID=117978 RepID=A0ABD0VJD2_DENTH